MVSMFSMRLLIGNNYSHHINANNRSNADSYLTQCLSLTHYETFMVTLQQYSNSVERHLLHSSV
jgi:hypothetical protein